MPEVSSTADMMSPLALFLAADIVVKIVMLGLLAASVAIHQRVMRGTEQLTDARLTAAFLTPDGRPTRQPREWVERFRAIEAKGK